MISLDLLLELGFESEDVDYIAEIDNLYGNLIKTISEEYMARNTFDTSKPYTPDEAEKLYSFASECLKKCASVCSDCDNEYIINLLFWLYCIPFVHTAYVQKGISEEVFYDSMSDLVYKTRECKEQRGMCGVYVDWFFQIFDMHIFALGRLEYSFDYYRFNDYTFGDYSLKKGDCVYGCHIPSSGKLDEALCMDSFQRAYEFYKDSLKSTVIPIVCKSWLLYPPYVRDVFPKGGNLIKFAALFDITEEISTQRMFSDCPRVFAKEFNGSIDEFPADNSLRRNFIEYINSGREFGSGVGIILYDGEKKKIINRK